MTTHSTTIAPVASLCSDAPKRLMLLSTAMAVGGGAEEQVLRLAYAFKERGWEVMIVSMLPPGVMPPDFADHGIPLLHLGMKRAVPDPRGLYRLVRAIRQFRPHVVHSHMTHANLLARAARVFAPFPALVCTLHNLTMAGVQRDHTTFFEFAHRITDALAERTTTICHAASDYYIQRRAVPASKMMVVPNGIDCQRYFPNPAARQRLRQEMGIDGDFVWLAVGRLELQKAYPTMLRAFTQLSSPRSTLLICGRGSLRDQLIALAGELGVGSRARFLGLRSDVPDLMSAADGFVLSSDMEGLPLVLLQACAAGLPIVATNVSGNPEVVIHGVNGYVVAPGAPDALAAAMDRVASLSRSERCAKGRAGRERVQTMFAVEPVVDRWEQLFGELLSVCNGQRRRRASPATLADGNGHANRFQSVGAG
jgi:glycosyltransferase involved in cell wall biosynthesis